MKASPTAESVFTAVIVYLEKRPDVDAKRIAIMGRSFGGYWAAKMASPATIGPKPSKLVRAETAAVRASRPS